MKNQPGTCRCNLWLHLKLQVKVDNRRKTGSAGGSTCKLNEIDNLVLNTIGKDSPLVTSLGVPETWESQSAACSSGGIDNDTTLAGCIIQNTEATEEQREHRDIPVANTPNGIVKYCNLVVYIIKEE